MAAAVAVAVSAVGVPAFAATGSMSMSVTLTGLEFGTPAEVVAECPDGWLERGGLFIKTHETVEFASAVYTGPLDAVSDQHCSVPQPPLTTWIDGTRRATPIELENGELHLATPAGVTPAGELHLTYRAPGVIMGPLFGPNTHAFNGPYTVVGGSGIFDDATGHGHATGVVQQVLTGDPMMPFGYTGGWELHGTLRVPD